MNEGSIKAVVVEQNTKELATLDDQVEDENPVIEPKPAVGQVSFSPGLN